MRPLFNLCTCIVVGTLTSLCCAVGGGSRALIHTPWYPALRLREYALCGWWCFPGSFRNARYCGLPSLSLSLRRGRHRAQATELVTTEALAVRIEAYYQHLCRPPASALSVAAAGAARAAANRTMSRTGGGRGGSDGGGGGGGGAFVAAAEAFAKQGWQTDDGALTGIGGAT